MTKGKKSKSKNSFGIINFILLLALVLSLSANQFFVAKTSQALGGEEDFVAKLLSLASRSDKKDANTSLSDVDVMSISSTAQAVAALFSLDQAETAEDVMAIMIPTGTPDYGEEMGVSYDTPAESMNKMSSAYNALKKEAEGKPEIWDRYLKLAAAPRGISCEFCCGVGPQGIDENGRSKCGCKHNPALQTATIWLMMNTDYNDAQILKEVMKWKTLWFPKDMVGLAVKIFGGDTSVLEELPSMVGGC